MKPLIFIAHPLSGDVAANLSKVKQWYLALTMEVPEADFLVHWAIDCEVFDDADPKQRAEGLQRNERLLMRCDGLVACGESVTPGMVYEIEHALELRIPICDVTKESEPIQEVRRFVERLLECES